jgi:hypothetical protein
MAPAKGEDTNILVNSNNISNFNGAKNLSLAENIKNDVSSINNNNDNIINNVPSFKDSYYYKFMNEKKKEDKENNINVIHNNNIVDNNNKVICLNENKSIMKNCVSFKINERLVKSLFEMKYEIDISEISSDRINNHSSNLYSSGHYDSRTSFNGTRFIRIEKINPTNFRFNNLFQSPQNQQQQNATSVAYPTYEVTKTIHQNPQIKKNIIEEIKVSEKIKSKFII